MTDASRRIARTLGTGIIVAVLGAPSALGALNTFSSTDPVEASDGSGSIGTMRVTKVYTDGMVIKRVTVRGSVRVEAGTWCVETSLLPRRPQIRTRRALETLDRAGVILVPRFTKASVHNFRFGDTVGGELVRVSVRAGSCQGPLVAQGHHYEGGE